MFPSFIVSEAIALATNAAERGIAINGHPNSFLDNLVGISKNAVDTNMTSVDTTGARYDRTYAYGDVMDASHAAFTDQTVVDVGTVVANNQHVARSDALPMIKSVMESFQQVINPDIPYGYRKRAVIPVAFQPIWQSEYVQEIAQAYHDGATAGPIPTGLVLSLEEEQFSDFVALSKTGIASVDKLLEEMLSGYDVAYLVELFANTFAHGSMSVVRGPQSLCEGWINDQILIHVWARNLVEMAPSKSAHGLPGYRSGVAAVIARSGHNVWNINKVRQNCAEQNVVILAYTGEQVFVHSDTYTTWLKQGGSPEIILGASLLVGQLRPATGADLTTMAPALIEKWNNYVSITSRTEQESLNAAARTELFKVIRQKIYERKNANLLGSYDDAMLRLNDSIGVLPTNFIKNPYPFIRDVVLNTFYIGTDVALFVLAMDEVASDDPELNEEEVASIATVNYITDWMCKLLSIKDGNR